MKKGCQHPNMIMIEDENHDEHLPVKKVLICADCNDEIVNQHLMLQTDSGKKWRRSEDHNHQLELIKKDPLYIRKTKP